MPLHLGLFYLIYYSMFTLYFKCIMQSKGPNIGQLWAEITLAEATRIVYCSCPLSFPFYFPKLPKEIPTTSACYLFMKYTWVFLWIVFILIRILAAQRTHAWSAVIKERTHILVLEIHSYTIIAKLKKFSAFFWFSEYHCYFSCCSLLLSHCMCSNSPCAS